MAKNKKSKGIFLISFVPALGYWYLEANYSLQTALIGGVSLAAIEILLEKALFKRVHSISKINCALIIVLGGIAFWGKDGIWFKLQPFFTGVGLGSILLIQNLRGKSIMWNMMQEVQTRQMPLRLLLEPLERDMGIFTVIYGVFMGGVAVWRSSDEWLFFKTAGLYIAYLLFMIVEIFILTKKRAFNLK